MRNIGVFTARPIQPAELVEFVSSYSSSLGQQSTRRDGETIVGNEPNFLYVFDETSVEQGYAAEEDSRLVESKMGTHPKSYVNMHFTSTEGAASLAEAFAQEIRRRWNGIIDYSGAGGDLDVPPEHHRGQ